MVHLRLKLRHALHLDLQLLVDVLDLFLDHGKEFPVVARNDNPAPPVFPTAPR
jgi:hypothetical protein